MWVVPSKHQEWWARETREQRTKLFKDNNNVFAIVGEWVIPWRMYKASNIKQNYVDENWALYYYKFSLLPLGILTLNVVNICVFYLMFGWILLTL